MTKRAEHSTQLKEDVKHPRPPEPAQQTGKNEHDARGDDGKLAQNQRDLGVKPGAPDGDHKTEDMEKGGRGTFP